MPTATATRNQPPTPAQLVYVKALAERAGETIALPASREEASRLISQLRQRLSSESDAERTMRGEAAARERDAVAADLRTGAGDATRYRADETTGYGSSARWAGREPRDEVVSSDPVPVRLIPQLGPRKELGRYRTADGAERILWGQRINGVARVTDRPASERLNGRERAHLVADKLTNGREMTAAITDWVTRAQRLGVCPGDAIPYDYFLAGLREQPN